MSCGLKSLVINRPQLIQLIYSSEVIEWSFFHLEFPESVHLQDCVFVRRNETEGNGRKIYIWTAVFDLLTCLRNSRRPPEGFQQQSLGEHKSEQRYLTLGSPRIYSRQFKIFCLPAQVMLDWQLCRNNKDRSNPMRNNNISNQPQQDRMDGPASGYKQGQTGATTTFTFCIDLFCV